MNCLSKFRSELNMTQLELSNAIGVSRTTIQNIESDNKIPSVKLALQLASLFNCKVEDIFDYNTNIER